MLRYLVGRSEESAKEHFISEHEQFLTRHGLHAEERRRTRWMRFLEEPSAECAAWPTVFWGEGFCLAMERANDPQRKEVGRQTLEAFMAGGDNFFGDFERAGDIGAPALQEGKHSINRLFCVLGLSTDLNFTASEEILHFANDLHVWSSVGVRRHMNLSILCA